MFLIETVHDLNRETTYCRINEIKSNHVYNCDSYESAQAYSIIVDQRDCNGCDYSIPEKENG